MRAFYTIRAEQIQSIERFEGDVISTARVQTGRDKAEAASAKPGDQVHGDVVPGMRAAGSEPVRGPAEGAARLNPQPDDPNGVRDPRAVDPNNPDGRTAEGGKFTDNRSGVAQVDQGTDKILQDQAANRPASSGETKHGSPYVIVTTQYGARHRIDQDALLFSPAIEDRKLPVNDAGDPVGDDTPFSRVRSGDWLVTDFDIRDDEVIHKVYDDATFSSYFNQSLQG